jgi:predicted RNA-binding Zn-ribbon protein involved in translation (DUF1610 family)
MNGKERDEHVIICPRCGVDAEWSLLNEAKTSIEVLCPDCGRYEMTRDEFDAEAAESAEMNEAEHG